MKLNSKRFSTIFLMLFLILCLGEAQAQFEFKWMTVGSMWSPYSEGGANREQEPFDNAPVFYPAIDHRGGNTRAQALWIGVRNFTDEKGRNFAYKIAGIGPRSGGEVQFFPVSSEVVAKYDPKVEVDGAQSFRQFVFIDKVDPTLVEDRMIRVNATSRVGIDVEQRIHAFSQEYHDSYHIIEYKFTNTGNVDTDAEAELNAPLEGVYFYLINRYATHEAASWVTGNGAPWGKFTMNDVIGDGQNDYGVNFRAQYAWGGFSVFQTDFNALGGPMWQSGGDFAAPVPDLTGRLASAHMMGRVYIHADRSATDETDDPAQPSTMGVKGSDDPDLVTDEFNNGLMQRQYENFLLQGRPGGPKLAHSHAFEVEPTGEFDKPTKDPAQAFGRYDEGGWAMGEGFGPYTMNIGETINIVIAEGAAGLGSKAKLEIGMAYKAGGAIKDEILIPFTVNGQVIQKTKNQWVMTARDSVFQMFDRATANWNADMRIPSPPPPPSRFVVTSGVGRITLEWEYSGPALNGWEVYRKAKQYQDDFDYQLIATLPPDARRYEDSQNLERGVGYFYYLQAVGDINTDPAGKTPTGVRLKSGRYYTQTYLPATLKRSPGTNLSQVRVVPNPYNLAATEDIRFPGRNNQGNQLAFYDIPGQCTIKIYTQLGELVQTIEHTNGSGDEFWDQSTASKQVVSSGIYVAVIEDKSNGQKIIKKFVIIR
jgi:hypothetical protein